MRALTEIEEREFQLVLAVTNLRSMVIELADELEANLAYKSDYLVEKHGDRDTIAEARAMVQMYEGITK